MICSACSSPLQVTPFVSDDGSRTLSATFTLSATCGNCGTFTFMHAYSRPIAAFEALGGHGGGWPRSAVGRLTTSDRGSLE